MGLAWRKRSGAAAKKEERGRGYANRICGCYGLVRTTQFAHTLCLHSRSSPISI
ncbi:hypothetical protein GQ55_9G310000 [Panicum hallii var. hallii]|uniref:Uncharacterized protein n=1 Tax=Panicum hallii var. hallii TaxID=1504633 RepID=A0A2T7C7Z9_9POAL|nr:hypothetical protein GQ55_9G310000 [Panicum hallii var. hallii]